MSNPCRLQAGGYPIIVPTVSVVIPTYNAAAFVGQAIKSVLAQTYRDVEVIVVDDGSTDQTQSILSRFGAPVRCIRQANQGVAVARNCGIHESRGRYVAFLDADDTWLPGKLERQVAALEAYPDCAACYAAFTRVDWELRPIGISRSPRQAATLPDLLLNGNVIGSICTVLIERELFDRVGGFDPQLSQCADWDMWIRLAVHTAFLYVDEPLVTYRQHEANMSRDARLLETDSLRVLEKGFAMPGLPESLRRRRRAALARNWTVLAGTYFHAGMYRDFLRCAARAVAMDARQFGYLAAFPCRWMQRRRSGGLLEA